MTSSFDRVGGRRRADGGDCVVGLSPFRGAKSPPPPLPKRASVHGDGARSPVRSESHHQSQSNPCHPNHGMARLWRLRVGRAAARSVGYASTLRQVLYKHTHTHTHTHNHHHHASRPARPSGRCASPGSAPESESTRQPVRVISRVQPLTAFGAYART